MTEVMDSISAWVEDAPSDQLQERIDTIRMAIGRTLTERYTQLKSEEQLTLDALARLGMSPNIEKSPQDILMYREEFFETGLELGVANVQVWSTLWSGLWSKHVECSPPNPKIHNHHWIELFDEERRLSLLNLEHLYLSQRIKEARKIGDKCELAAIALLKAKLHPLEDNPDNLPNSV